jgi:PAS domain S-box-containing protein
MNRATSGRTDSFSLCGLQSANCNPQLTGLHPALSTPQQKMMLHEALLSTMLSSRAACRMGCLGMPEARNGRLLRASHMNGSDSNVGRNPQAGSAANPTSEMLITDLSTRFIHLPADQVDREVAEAQRRIVEALGLDRSTLFETSDGGAEWRVTHCYAAPGRKPTIRLLSRQDLPWMAERILSGETVMLSSVDQLPPEAAGDKETMLMLESQASLVFPLSAGGAVLGALSFGQTSVDREWPEEVVDCLRLAADIFAGALARKRSDQALRESEEQYRSLFAAMAEGAVLQAADGTIVAWNTSAERILGLTADQMAGRASLDPLWRSVHEDGSPFPSETHPAMVALQTGQPCSNVVMRIHKPGGSLAWISINAQPIFRAGESKAWAVVSTFMDITERREMQRKLQEAVEGWSVTFDSIQDMVMMLDHEFKVLQANSAARAFLDRPLDSILGEHCYALMHGTEAPPAECPFSRVVQTKHHEEAEIYDQAKGLWLSVSADPILDEKGNMARAVHTVKDITARKRAAEQLLQSQALISAAFSSLDTHVAVIDQAGVIITVNGAWLRWAHEHGARLEAVSAGVNYIEVCRRAHAAGDQEARMAAKGIEAVLNGSAPHFRMEYRCGPPMAERSFDMMVRPLKRPEGGAVVSHNNITTLRRAEMEAQRLRQELSHVTRVATMGELATSLAHEMNQPLAAILSNAQAALRLMSSGRASKEELHEILTDIVADDQRAGEVIRHLRSYLKKEELDSQVLNLNDLIREVAGLLSREALGSGISIRLELSPDLLPVRGDRIQLQQVILNLMLNAMDAMRETAEHDRRLGISTSRPDEATVRVTVEDSGPGIPPGMSDQIFEPFFSGKLHGMGMGLAICRSIVGAHGGRIWESGSPCRGATFQFDLPALVPVS